MKALKIMILFIIVLSGCSEKYLDPGEEELVGREIVDSWKKLEIKFIEQDEEAFYLNCQVKDFIKVADSIKLKDFYGEESLNKKSIDENTNVFEGFSRIGVGCGILACASILVAYYAWESQWDNSVDKSMGCFLGVLLAGATLGPLAVFLIPDESSYRLPQEEIYYASKPYRVRSDILCVKSTLISAEKIKVEVKDMNFKKILYTDKFGNIRLEILEVLSKPVASDEIIKLIVQYEEMIDTVDVEIR